MFEIIQPSMAKRTTIHLGGTALAELYPETEEDLALLPELVQKYGGSLYPLGRGSNLLARGGELPLVLVRLDRLADMAIVGQYGEIVEIRAGAGVSLRRLLRFCRTEELSGLEGLVGIPGSLGGAVAMNAGSFGTVIGDCLKSITVWHEGGVKQVNREELVFSYRQLQLRGYNELPLIVAANLALTRTNKSVIFNSTSLNFFKKKSVQPVGVWSAGCAFKNPPGESAGKLLDMAGFRGRRLGGMTFSPVHANFLVNGGNGSSAEALEFLSLARDAVERMSGIKLELEIRIVPCPWS